MKLGVFLALYKKSNSTDVEEKDFNIVREVISVATCSVHFFKDFFYALIFADNIFPRRTVFLCQLIKEKLNNNVNNRRADKQCKVLFSIYIYIYLSCILRLSNIASLSVMLANVTKQIE